MLQEQLALFKKSWRWNFYGCILYEAIQFFHTTLLIQHMQTPLYAILVTTLSLIPLAAKCSDFGFSASLPSYWLSLTKNRKTFSTLLMRHTITPLIIFSGISCIVFACVLRLSDSVNWVTILACCVLALAETCVAFLRRLLNLAWLTNAVVSGEILAFALKVSLWWLVWLTWHSVPLVLGLIVGHRLLLAGYFAYLYRRFVRQLPTTTEEFPLQKNLLFIQLSTGGLRVCRELCAAPALTCYIAYSNGIAPASLLYAASKLASSLQSLVKMTLGYSGAALLAQGAEHVSLFFSTLSKQLTNGIIIISIALACNADYLVHTYNLFSLLGAHTLTWILIQTLDSMAVVYENYYIRQQASQQLLCIRLLEVAMVGIGAYFLSSTLHLFIALLCLIKSISLLLTWWYAYIRWHVSWVVAPSFQPVCVGLIIGILLRCSCI